MRIAPMTMATNYANKTAFKGDKKPNIQVNDNTPDDQVVATGTWGPNYVYPITAGQVRKSIAESAARKAEELTAKAESHTETPEEYYQRKLYSPEWAM